MWCDILPHCGAELPMAYLALLDEFCLSKVNLRNGKQKAESANRTAEKNAPRTHDISSI